MNTLFSLLVIFQVKHYLCDYILQTPYMLKKFLPGKEYILPLLAHVAVHGVFTLGICLMIEPQMWWLSLVDMSIHFAMDRIKASPKLLGRFKLLSAKEYKHNLYMLGPGRMPTILTNTVYTKIHQEFKRNTYFWWSLGLDQMVHHLTDIWIVYMLVT